MAKQTRRRYSPDEVIDLFEKVGCQIVDISNYTKQKDPIVYRCSKHGIKITTLDTFLRGSRCKECASESLQIKVTIDELINYCKNKRYVISEKSVQINIFNVGDSVEFICENHKSLGIQLYPIESMLQKRDSCKSCRYESMGNSNTKKISHEDLEISMLSLGLVLLEESSYFTQKSKISFICSRHEHVGMQISTALSIQKRMCVCKKCKYEQSTIKKLKTDRNDLLAEKFKERNCTLLDGQSYTGATHRLYFICDIHFIMGEQYTTWERLCKNKYICLHCRNEEKIGSGGANWQGGISYLAEYLRDRIKEWKIESMINCDYKCVITGGSFDVVHHLYSFNLIVKECFKELKIEKRIRVNDYSDVELEEIKNKTIELHNKYPLGVCLSNEVHDLYHDLYKYNNTPEQFEEFKTKYETGEINMNQFSAK